MRKVVIENGVKISSYLVSALIVIALYWALFGELFGILASGNSGFSLFPFLFGYFANRHPNRQKLSFSQNLLLMSIYLLVSTAGYVYSTDYAHGQISTRYLSQEYGISYRSYLLFIDFFLAFVIYKVGLKYFFVQGVGSKA